jgi:hypothetical protein
VRSVAWVISIIIGKMATWVISVDMVMRVISVIRVFLSIHYAPADFLPSM